MLIAPSFRALPSAQNIIKHPGEVKEEDKVASAFCGLQTTTRSEAFFFSHMDWRLQSNVLLLEQPFRKKLSSLFKALKETEMDSEETFRASGALFDEFENWVQLHNVKNYQCRLRSSS